MLDENTLWRDSLRVLGILYKVQNSETRNNVFFLLL
uniref:Uncharacterized protein n=1 Tax=Anguilla anguilla TaxID=7936 RepID=A0A0E9WAK0_ANGAN